jgi:hypothetical protein
LGSLPGRRRGAFHRGIRISKLLQDVVSVDLRIRPHELIQNHGQRVFLGLNLVQQPGDRQLFADDALCLALNRAGSPDGNETRQPKKQEYERKAGLEAKQHTSRIYVL